MGYLLAMERQAPVTQPLGVRMRIQSSDCPAVKVPARVVARRFGHYEWFINGLDAAWICGSVPAAFRGRRGLRNAHQRRALARRPY